MAAIDYDRGVHIRRHAASGMQVFMYVDEPGVFRSAFGTEIDPAVAREAGFDVDRLIKEKLKRARMSEAQRLIEQEFDASNTREVVAEKHGFKVEHIGLGRHSVIDPDGNRLNQRPLTLDEAKKLLNQIATPKMDDNDDK